MIAPKGVCDNEVPSELDGCAKREFPVVKKKGLEKPPVTQM
jgi:hypothetical protein